MAKKKIIRKSNRPFTYNPHYYTWGGDFKKALGDLGPFDLKGTFSGANVANMLKGGIASGLGSAVGKIGGGLIGGGLKSGAGSAISNIGGAVGGAVGMVNPVLGGAISAGSGIIGGITNRMFGSKLNEEKIAEIEGSNKAINTVMVDNSSADSVMNQWANQDFGSDFTKSDIGEDGWFSDKAKNKYKELKLQQDIARNRALTSYENAADAADTQSDLNAMVTFAAYGGPLDIWGGYGGGAIGYELAKGGRIHIKPENRGKFTKYCGGKVTSECIARGKRSSDPAVRKRATFAANARKWHHAFGGDLLTHGAEWDNGVTIIGNGDIHENNPYEGVQMGVDNQGIPNLVEEGEVVFNDYVFSNRLIVPDAVREKYKLRGNKELTFADAAKQMQKESEERPNDPISKRGLMSAMSRLQQAQEVVREEKQANQEGRQYAEGGKMGRKYNGKGSEPNFLQFYTPQEKYLRTLQSQGVVPTYTFDTLKKPYRMITPEDIASISNIETPSLVDTRTLYEKWKDETIKPVPSNLFSTTNSTGSTSTDTDSSRQGPTWLRYAPVVGAAIGLGQNLFSRPDYTSANAILEAANQAGNYTPVGYTPIGNYLQYRPFDRNFYLNKLNAQAGATRRAIMNTSSPSRNAALLAADYNAQGRLGDLARQAEEYNLAQRQAVEQFNRGTNQANAEMGLKAAMANQEAALKARSSRLSGVAQAMAVRDAVDARRGASMSANLTNLFDSLGNIGIDEMNRADRDMLIRAGVFGTLSEKPQGWSNKRWEDYKKAISGKGYSRGGKLKKRRGGLTY